MTRSPCTNPALAAVPLVRLVLFGAALGVAAMGLGELLLVVSQ